MLGSVNSLIQGSKREGRGEEKNGTLFYCTKVFVSRVKRGDVSFYRNVPIKSHFFLSVCVVLVMDKNAAEEK